MKWLFNPSGRRRRQVITYSALHHSETFIVSSVTTVLFVRLLLQLTGYPALGGGELHIAHVLYGGIFMLAAISLQLNLLGDRPRAASALLGGIGFGLFVDELGKFVTKDNDYFFQPTALLLYGLFIAMWFLARQIDERRSHSQRSAIANVLELLQEGLLYGFNSYEQGQLQSQFSRLKPGNPATRPLQELTAYIKSQAREDELGLTMRLGQLASSTYGRLLKWRYFKQLLFVAFGLQLLLSAEGLVDFIRELMSGQSLDFGTNPALSEIGQIVGTTLYGLIIIVGFSRLKRSSLEGFRLFKNAQLLNLLVTQCFAFYRLKFWAVFSLLINIGLLIAVNYMLAQQRQHSHKIAA